MAKKKNKKVRYFIFEGRKTGYLRVFPSYKSPAQLQKTIKFGVVYGPYKTHKDAQDDVTSKFLRQEDANKKYRDSSYGVKLLKKYSK